MIRTTTTNPSLRGAKRRSNPTFLMWDDGLLRFARNDGIESVMRTFIRSVIAVVAGFLLMWPLGYAYVALSLPTFHLWGLMHGTYVAAWPTLSILAFLALGYLPPFRRIDDTALLIA